jgi:prepilin-type N-terminal cleavage/methylation domain-containing protein
MDQAGHRERDGDGRPAVTARWTRERGFTVIEVLIAIVLLATGLLATARLMVVATSHGRLAKQASDAATLAAHTIERYRDKNYDTITGGTFVTTPIVGADTYTVTTVVTRDIPANRTTINVTVTWNGGTQSYVSATILSNLQ